MDRATIPKSTDRSTWLADRHGYFNASAAAVLYDRHPFVSPADYAVEKLGEVTDAPPTEPMNRGRHLEAGVANWFAETMGWTLIEPDVLYTYGPLCATVDRIVVETGSPVEIKTYNGYVSEPLPYWVDQCQAVLACTDTDTIYLVWMDASMLLQWVEIDRNEAHIADMVARADRFMAAIDLGMVPDWIEMDASHVAALHPDPEGEVELDDETVAMLVDYKEHQAAVKYHEEQMSAIKGKVATILGDHVAGIHDGRKVVSFSKVNGRKSFDQAAFKQDHPQLADKYTKTGAPSRRFTVSITGGNDE